MPVRILSEDIENPEAIVAPHNVAADSHADIRTSVNAVESRTTSLESDVATAQGDISTLQTDVSTLQTDVSAVEGDISTLQGNVTTLTQEIVDARNAGHAALSNVLPSAASQNHLTDDELEFLGTLPSTISALMSNVEEVDADFVSISYNPSGTPAAIALTIAGWSFDFVSLDSGDYEAWTSGTSWASAGGVTAQENISTDPVAYVSGGDYYKLTGGTGWAGSGTLVQYTL